MVRYIMILVMLVSLGIPGEAAEKTLRVATLEWEPYVGNELKDGGFTADIVTTVFQQAGYTVHIDFMPWARVLSLVKHGKYDGGFPAYYSEERAKTYAMSDPFAQGPLVFYTLKSSDIPYTGLEDLKPYKIGIVRGYVNTPEFDEADYLKKDVADNDAQNLKKLLYNRIDLIVIDKLTAQHIINTTMPERGDELKAMEPPLEEKSLHLLLSREKEGYEHILADFNQALEQLQADGTIKAILKKHGFE